MRIETVTKVAAAPEAVHARLADFAAFEARAADRGIPVERLSEDPPAWRIGVAFGGIRREVELRVVSATPPGGYVAELATPGVAGRAVVAIAADAGGSVLTVTVEAAAQGIAGRLTLQGLGVAAPFLQARLAGALARLGRELEDGGGGGG